MALDNSARMQHYVRDGYMESLAPAVFDILLSLVNGEKDGYAFMQDVAASTYGGFTMGPGTRFGTVKRMLRSGLVTEANGFDPESEGERRKSYRLIAAGRKAAKAEVLRVHRALEVASDRSLVTLRNLEAR